MPASEQLPERAAHQQLGAAWVCGLGVFGEPGFGDGAVDGALAVLGAAINGNVRAENSQATVARITRWGVKRSGSGPGGVRLYQTLRIGQIDLMNR